MISSSERARLTNLPADITSFVGRRREIAEGRNLLSASRLLTCTGVGGVGKTRLALRLAEEVRGRFPDGVWLVELAEASDGASAMHATIGILRQAVRSNHETIGAIADHLGDRKLLLVLDNCEQVAEACGELVHVLLKSCPNVHVLATSREPLGVPGEQLLQLPPLSFPTLDAPSAMSAFAQYESVNLFLHRAAAGVSDFEVTDENRPMIAKICQELEGLPLAIELAAVRVRSLPLGHIVDRLADRFSLLKQSSTTVPTRQQTLRASVEWSYDLCSRHEQLVWQRVAVCSGGFDLAAAEAICETAELPSGAIADLVGSLLDKSVLTRDRRKAGDRYRMLETLREYGLELLQRGGDPDGIRRSHRAWYDDLCAVAHEQWSMADQEDLLGRLRNEFANFRAAFNSSLGDADDDDAALRIAANLEHYWLACGRLTEGRQWLDAALGRALAPTPARGKALRVNAYLAILQGSADIAGQMLVEARSIAMRNADGVECAYALLFSGVRDLSVGALCNALAQLTQSLVEFRRLGERTGEGMALISMATAGVIKGDYDLVKRCHEECLAITEPHGEMDIRGFSLWARGLAALRTGELELAKELVRAGLRLKYTLADNFGIALCIESLAWTAAASADGERAAVLLGATEQFWGPMNMTVGAIAGLEEIHQQFEELLAQQLSIESREQLRKVGSKLSAEHALAIALDDGAPALPRPRRADGALTAREYEIAELIREGLTNRQLGSRLRISQRTAEAHVQHILDKLGFESRVQIAAWVAADHPPPTVGRDVHSAHVGTA